VRVSAEYPFDWIGVGNIDEHFARIWSALPGYDAESTYFFASPAAEPAGHRFQERLPPHLSCSIEPIGIQVYGVLPRRDWERWRGAFERLTVHLPMQRA
jgi:hypothetical protein